MFYYVVLYVNKLMTIVIIKGDIEIIYTGGYIDDE